MKYYSGIGARKTPNDILNAMRVIASKLSTRDWVLRSGGAAGADSAFEHGCSTYKGNMRIYNANEATIKAVEMAAEFHPAWDRCSSYAQRLHGRNMMILLGQNLDTPVEMVICWTPYAKITGGTGQAIRCALAHKIPIYNLAVPETLEKLNEKYELND